MVGQRFSDACRNSTNANFSPQLYADARARVGVFQIVDQLRHVFDGIDVMVRRWTNKTNTRSGVAQAGDVVIHLWTRQFATFTGLCALDDLDLQLVSVGQVVDGDAKATTGHLFDG